ncbi:hypothetical protein JX266_007626 [Neoarthrinium moseri]|nr:hypothetical protein JX266_007626 [Neoarthrinium moseri]
MRLLSSETLQLHEFQGDFEHDYAILSHTWGQGECTLQHMSSPNAAIVGLEGYEKIRLCCEQARHDQLKWVWVDTCCIDKTSTAELSESINSMFRWYQKAKVCYAYLKDVHHISELARSRWFTRGWTLQELIAPRDLLFYSTDWTCLGSKADLRRDLEAITSISGDVLSDASRFRQVCIASRMRWAAHRQTTRLEDMAYSLMGIFDVNMPLLYGEGSKSFTRLQQEIMRGSDDQSLFAWGVPQSPVSVEHINQSLSSNERHGLLAKSPQDFMIASEIQPVRSKQPPTATSISNTSVRIDLPVVNIGGRQVAVIACTVSGRPGTYVGFVLNQWDRFYTSRGVKLFEISDSEWIRSAIETLEIREISSVLPLAPPLVISIQLEITAWLHHGDVEIHALPGASYHRAKRLVVGHGYSGIHAVLILDPSVYPPSRYEEHPGFAIILGADSRPWVSLVPILHPDRRAKQFHRLAASNPDFIKFCMTKSALLALLSKKQGEMNFLNGRAERLDLVLDRESIPRGKNLEIRTGRPIKKVVKTVDVCLHLRVHFEEVSSDHLIDSKVCITIE